MMSNSPALDVSFGLALVFLLFSLAASKINETIASLLSLRHQGLEKALVALLGSAAGGLSAEAVLGHDLVRGLQAAGSDRGQRVRHMLRLPGRGISYLPSRTFSAAVLDLLAPADWPDPQQVLAGVSPDARPAVDDPPRQALVQALVQVSALDQANPARRPLMRMLADAQGDRDRFRQSLERWYDDAMDRVSGWYKRYVQRIILAISIVLVVVLNVDTINIAQVLWRSPTERAAVASAAAAHVAAGGDASQSADQQVRAILALSLPLGWTPPHTKSATSTDPRHAPLTLGSWLIKLLGLVLSVLALSLGAPFWFDALSKLAQLRLSGPKPVKS
jgi:hypothetical protein